MIIHFSLVAFMILSLALSHFIMMSVYSTWCSLNFLNISIKALFTKFGEILAIISHILLSLSLFLKLFMHILIC